VVHLDKIPEKRTGQLFRALDNGYEGLYKWDSAKAFVAAIEEELLRRRKAVRLDDKTT
jgi:hypothetical protein